jgi:hypothetical protein
MLPAVARRATVVELSDVRTAAGVMLVGAAVRAAMAHPVGIACPMRTITGVPCPLCGMTTSVTAAARFDVAGSVAANPGGLVAIAVAVAVLVFRQRRTISMPAWVMPAALGLMWVFELHRFHVIV